MEQENQRIAITKRLLKESLLRLLEDKELDRITVTELCREAGINRVTFYRHYQVPREILLEIGKDLYRCMKQTIHLPNAPEQVKPCIDQMCAYMEQHASVLRVLIRCNSDTDFVKFVNEIYTEIWNEVRKLEIARDLTYEDMKLPTLFCAGGSYFILRYWLLGDIHKSAAEIADRVYEILRKTDSAILNAHPTQYSEQSLKLLFAGSGEGFLTK